MVKILLVEDQEAAWRGDAGGLQVGADLSKSGCEGRQAAGPVQSRAESRGATPV